MSRKDQDRGPVATVRLRLLHGRTTIGVFAAAVLVYIVTLIVVPQFANLGHFASLFNIAAILGVLAIGSGIVIMGGGIDLSVASVATAAGVLASTLTAAHWPGWVIIIASLAVGVVVGFVNGSAVARLGIPPLVVTLAVGSIVQGIELIATGGTPNSSAPVFLQTIMNTQVVLGISGASVLWVVLTAVAVVVLTGTQFGRSVYAVGTNSRASELAGLQVKRTLIWTYVISGCGAALTGLILLGYTGTSTSTAGDAYLLPAIAAVVLGGVSILGGQGSVLAIAAGVFLLTSIESLLTVVNVSNAVRQMLEGAILLIVLALYSARDRPSQRGRRAARRYTVPAESQGQRTT